MSNTLALTPYDLGSDVLEHGTVWPGESVTSTRGNASILIRGDVHGTVFARGGGAKILVIGDVHPNAVVEAQGGGATVVIQGRVL